MHWRKITKILLVVVAVTLIVYDFFPFFNPDRGDTISEVILYYSLHLFSLPLAFGVLCGHFFFPRDGVKPKPYVTLPIAAMSITIDVLTHTYNVEILEKAQTYPFIWFLVGIPVGALFWTQSKEDKI